MRVCIYGAASDLVAAHYKTAAWELGRKLAAHQIGLVFGAGATGLMGAAARGFQTDSTDGELIGVAPRFFDQPGVLYPSCSQMIWTETMRERKQKMEELSDAFIVLPGGIGTLEEFFEILTLKQLGRHQKPVFVYNTDGYYEQMHQMLLQGVKEHFLKASHLELCVFTEKGEEIVSALLESV